MSELPLNIKISANPAEAIRAFGDLKKRVGESATAFQEAQQKTKEAAKAWQESQKAADGLAVQVALGKKALAELGQTVSQKAPEWLGLKESIKSTEAAWKQANAQAKESAKAFDTAKGTAADLKTALAGQAEALHRSRQSLAVQGVDVTRLAGEHRRLQQAYAQTKAAANQLAATGGQVGVLRGIKSGTDSISVQLATLKSQFLQFLSLDFLAGQAKTAINAADAMTLLNARMKLATGSLREYAAAKQGVIAIANQFGLSIGETGQAFSRLAQSVKSLGGSASLALQLTEAFAATARLSGATTQEAAESMRQFGQAMGSGTLQGDELRSILEGNQRLSQALADGLGISVGELKKWGEEGRLSAQAVAKAIASQMQTIRDETATIPQTVGASSEKVRNAFALWVDGSENVSRAQQSIIATLDVLAAHVDTVMTAVRLGVEALVGLLAGKAVTALAGWAASMAAATREAGLLAGALRFFGAPGLIIGGLVAIGLEFSRLGGSARQAGTQALSAIDKLKQANAEQRKLLDARPETQSAKTKSAAETEMAGLVERMNAAGKALADAQRGGNSTQITRATNEILALRGKIAEGGKAIAEQRKLMGEALGDFGMAAAGKKAQEEWGKIKQGLRTDSQKMADEIKDAMAKAKAAGIAETAPEVQAALASIREKYADKKGGGTGAKDDAYQIARGGIDAQKAANRDLLQDQQETIRLSEAALKRQLDAGLIGHQSYYAQLQTLREADLDAQIRATEQEAAILRQALANRPTDKGKAGAESEKLNEDLAAKLREVARLQAAKQEAIADVQAEAAQADKGLIQQLDQLKLKLLELKNVRVPDIIPADQAEEFQLRVKLLREQYAAMVDEFKAKGDEAGIAMMEKFFNKEAWQQMGDEMSKFSEQAARNMQDAFANFLFDPFKQGTDNMLLNFSAMLRRLAAESIASGVFDKLKGLFGDSKDGKDKGGLFSGLFDKLLGLFGGGGGDSGGGGFMDFIMGIFGGLSGSFDTGGYTGNAGTTTPAGVVHGQEFVFSAPATKALGVGTLSLLHALAGGRNPQAPRVGYALGGLVNLPTGAPAQSANGGQAAAAPRLTIINSIDPELARDYLESPRGEQVLHNYISRNSQTIKRMLA